MQRHRLLHAFLLLVLVLILASCAGSSPTIVRTVLPEALTRCRPEPEPPARLGDDVDLIAWIEAVRVAGEDCRSVVARVREINEDAAREP